MTDFSEIAPGHVFVARGKLQNVDADVVVVPTDGYFTVEPRWNGLWPDDPDVRSRRPSSWSIGSCEPIRPPRGRLGGPDLWFIDVAVHNGETPEQVISKIVVSVEKVLATCAGQSGGHGRSRPLVAIPTLGVSGGGLGGVRGELIRRLLAEARLSARRHGVDVVIVAYEPADHAAFQFIRRSSPPWLSADHDTAARQFAEKARSGDLALFVGAGVSMSSGLPSWGDLTEALMRKSPGLPVEPGHSLNALDLAELISLEDDNFRKNIVAELNTDAKPGLGHLLLAGLGCDEVVTTNFDLLYERAANYRDKRVAVLPWALLAERRPWLLKMHGDISNQESIVLSRGDFARYDSANGPAGAVVQALMMSRHLLVVGASMTDDNFLRLAHEVQDFFKAKSDGSRVLGTVLSLGSEPIRQRLLAKSFAYIDTSAGSIDQDDPRNLAIFLDAVGMYAASDTSFLLDARYRSLLDDTESEVADDVKRWTAKVARLAQAEPSGPWAELWKSLQGFGASTQVLQ